MEYHYMPKTTLEQQFVPQFTRDEADKEFPPIKVDGEGNVISGYKNPFRDTDPNILSNKNIMNNNIAIQCILPYIFFTDTKDIEISVLPGTDLQMNNCTFLPGSFNIYSWNRMINFAIEITDKNKEASFEWNVDKPFMFIYFNKPIYLKYKLMTDEMWAMCSEVKDITKLRNNITKMYNTVVSRRPKKLL